MSLFVLFLYMILYPHSLHLMVEMDTVHKVKTS